METRCRKFESSRPDQSQCGSVASIGTAPGLHPGNMRVRVSPDPPILDAAWRSWQRKALIKPRSPVRDRPPQPFLFWGSQEERHLPVKQTTRRFESCPQSQAGVTQRQSAILPRSKSRVRVPSPAPISCPCSPREGRDASNVDRCRFESCQGFHFAGASLMAESRSSKPELVGSIPIARSNLRNAAVAERLGASSVRKITSVRFGPVAPRKDEG